MTNYSIFDGQTPPTVADNDLTAVVLGTEFWVDATAYLVGVRFFQPTTNDPSSSTRTATLYTVDTATTGTPVTGASGISIPVSGPGWMTTTIDAVTLVADQRYKIAILHPDGKYAKTASYWTDNVSGGPGQNGHIVGPIHAPDIGEASGNRQGSFISSASMAFPNDSFSDANYWSDIVISDEMPARIHWVWTLGVGVGG
jgi:hypothetical protein